jgi:DNA mismatch repair ATPase MutS
MSETDYTSKRDNFLKQILDLRKLVSRILRNRESLKTDFENLCQLLDKIKSSLMEVVLEESDQ